MDVRRMHPRQEAECACRYRSIRSQALLHLGERPFFWLSFLCAFAKKSNSGAKRTKRFHPDLEHPPTAMEASQRNALPH
jgi:hypothetical protein